MSEWRSAWVTAPYPPELLPNTPRRPVPPHLDRASIAGSISCSRKSSQAPVEAELIYWLPPSRVKQSGKATTTGGMRCSPINRSSRSGRFSRKPTQFVWDKPLLVNPTRSTSKGKPFPSCAAGTYMSTTRTDGSPSILLLRAWLSIVIRLTEPIGPKNLRIGPTPAPTDIISEHGGSPACGAHHKQVSGAQVCLHHLIRRMGVQAAVSLLG